VRKWLIPTIPKQELALSLSLSITGALLAGSYGVLHDQVTYTISPAYFHGLKFLQFASADFGFHPRIFTSIIGFLATWWVGLIFGWVIGRIIKGSCSFKESYIRGIKALSILLITVICSGIISYFTSKITETPKKVEYWHRSFSNIQESAISSFRTVGYIHNAGYLGGGVGLVISSIWLIKTRKKST